mmetsp:Transcript_49164/g.106930  ORF Transcript_49164/g.106930 Transcript_49164/m.106930 type:complete len:705 (+) Transcript_49164:58-2172(+)
MTVAGSSTAPPVLDFDPREVDPEQVGQTRRLIGRVLAARGPAGLARALHVAPPQASQLKHRVACVTCRSRLDGLAGTLFASVGAEGSCATAVVAADAGQIPGPPDGPAPLSAWLAADAGKGLAPAPPALRDVGALAAFLTAFGTAGDEELAEDAGRRPGRSGGVVRCTHHAPRAVARAVVTSIAGNPASGHSTTPGSAGSEAVVVRERERYVALLREGTSDAEWRQLGSIDVDNAMCDLFAWLGDRGLCSSCVDGVTGALLEVRRTVAGTTPCTCSRCTGRCGEKALPAPLATPSSTPAPAPALASETPSALSRATGEPEFLRVQGRLRAICGVFRRELLPFNGRPVYKKEYAEAYLLYTNLRDWMVSGKPDAGGARCEGWAYVTDSAETPDKICSVWKVSGPRGWEEDRTLCVTTFEPLPEELRVGLGYDDGSAIARRLTANERGVLAVPLHDPEVLEEVLWEHEDPPPGRTRSGACAHVLNAKMAQRELRSWLRWLLRDRLEAQRRRVLAQAQVCASLCRLFACAALQQLEQAARDPEQGSRGRDKKGRAKKGAAQASLRDLDISLEVDCAVEVGCELGYGADFDNSANVVDVADGGDSAYRMATKSAACTPTTLADSAESTSSTRASSEEPPDEQGAKLAVAARRLMEQMGWRPEAVGEAVLDCAEVAAWREQHPRYRQAVSEERQKLKTQFKLWALSTEG